MMLEALRIVADWMADPTYGVNAALRQVPRDPNEPEPMRVLAITDSTREPSSGRTYVGPSLPYLALSLGGPSTLDGAVHAAWREATDVTVDVRLWVAKTDTARAKRDALYIVRAIMASLRELNRNEQEAARTRNSVGMTLASTVMAMETIEVAGDAACMAGVVLTCTMRDLRPTISTIPRPILRYSVGDSITARGGSFSRAHGGSGQKGYVDQSGVVRYVGPDVPADGSYDYGIRGLLIERDHGGALANDTVLGAGDWTAVGLHVASNAVAAPDGTMTADGLIVEAGPQTPSLSHGIGQLNGVCNGFARWLKRGSKDWWVMTVTDHNGTIYRDWFNVTAGAWGTSDPKLLRQKPFSAASGWVLVRSNFIPNPAPGLSGSVAFAPVDGDGLLTCTGDGTTICGYLWGPNVAPDSATFFTGPYDGITPTGVLQDALAFPHTVVGPTPTVYLKFVDVGTSFLARQRTANLWEIGNVIGGRPPGGIMQVWTWVTRATALGPGPYVETGPTFGYYVNCASDTGYNNVRYAQVDVTHEPGDVVEVRAWLGSDLLPHIAVSINGAAEVVGSAFPEWDQGALLPLDSGIWTGTQMGPSPNWTHGAANAAYIGVAVFDVPDVPLARCRAY